MGKKGILPLILAALLPVSACGGAGPASAHQVAGQGTYYESRYHGLEGGTLEAFASCYDQANDAFYYAAHDEGETCLYQTGENSGRLPAYAFPQMEAILGAQGGGYYTNGLALDGQGGLWLGIVYGPDQRLLLQRVDAQGAELIRVDSASLLPEASFRPELGLTTDREGRLYAADKDNKVHVLDSQGELSFSLRLDPSNDSVTQLLRLGDGSVAALVAAPDGRALRLIDGDRRGWGQRIPLPFTPDMATGGPDYTLLYIAGGTLYGYEATTNTSTMILNWLDSGIVWGNLRQVCWRTGGGLLCLSQREDGSPQLITMVDSGQAHPPEKRTITLASTFSQYGILLDLIVLEFNQAYPDYQVKVVDYYGPGAEGLRDETRLHAARERLNLDIIAGRGPDMFHTEGLPTRQYAAAGLLEDLYPYLDGDEELSRADIIPQLLAAWETEGKLYSEAPDFYIHTAMGRADVAGIEPGLTYDGFLRLMAQYPEANQPLGPNGASMDALEAICRWSWALLWTGNRASAILTARTSPLCWNSRPGCREKPRRMGTRP